AQADRIDSGEEVADGLRIRARRQARLHLLPRRRGGVRIRAGDWPGNAYLPDGRWLRVHRRLPLNPGNPREGLLSGRRALQGAAMNIPVVQGTEARAPFASEIARRRTFAIISHPDAGKTTLTEKLLLFGGAIQLAGQVKAKRNRQSARSDWMTIERERGIS